MKRSLLVLGLLVTGSAYAADNQIYITQTTTGVTNTQIDIEQLGSGNVVAGDTSSTSTVDNAMILNLSLIHISEPTRLLSIGEGRGRV